MTSKRKSHATVEFSILYVNRNNAHLLSVLPTAPN